MAGMPRRSKVLRRVQDCKRSNFYVQYIVEGLHNIRDNWSKPAFLFWLHIKHIKKCN